MARPWFTRTQVVAVIAVIAAVIIAAAVYQFAIVVRDATQSLANQHLTDAINEATDGQRFSLLDYELSHLPNRWLGAAARLLGAEPMHEQEALARWFGDADPAARKAAEWHLERRIADAASALELHTPLPLFGGVRLVWPPVDVDLSPPLAVLTVSRRDEVRLLGTVLLDAVPATERISAMESLVEADGEHSAWVQSVGGVALYPAQIIEGRGFESTLDIVAHEWVHHYLVFHRLGLAYGANEDMRTINETVADIAGDEIAAAAMIDAAYDDPPPSDAALRWQDIRSETDPILRQLRIDVDALLDGGLVDEAEALMSEVRLELIARGRPYRRINQAFLAFRGGYAANASSASEWGGRLFALRAQSPSLARFMIDIRGIGSAREADALLPPAR